MVDIKVADTMPEGCMMYIIWKEAQDNVGKNLWPQDTAIFKKDAGEYVGFIRLVANRK